MKNTRLHLFRAKHRTKHAYWDTRTCTKEAIWINEDKMKLL